MRRHVHEPIVPASPEALFSAISDIASWPQSNPDLAATEPPAAGGGRGARSTCRRPAMTAKATARCCASPRAWVGVVSRAHVLRGVEGGFAQLCHGKHAPLSRDRTRSRTRLAFRWREHSEVSRRSCGCEPWLESRFPGYRRYDPNGSGEIRQVAGAGSIPCRRGLASVRGNPPVRPSCGSLRAPQMHRLDSPWSAHPPG